MTFKVARGEVPSPSGELKEGGRSWRERLPESNKTDDAVGFGRFSGIVHPIIFCHVKYMNMPRHLTGHYLTYRPIGK